MGQTCRYPVAVDFVWLQPQGHFTCFEIFWPLTGIHVSNSKVTSRGRQKFKGFSIRLNINSSAVLQLKSAITYMQV